MTWHFTRNVDVRPRPLNNSALEFTNNDDLIRYKKTILYITMTAMKYQRTNDYTKPFDAHCCHMGTAIKHPVPDRVKLSFVIFDIWAL